MLSTQEKWVPAQFESGYTNTTELVEYVQEELVGRRLTGKHVYMSEINLKTIQIPKYNLLLTLLYLNL